MNTLNQSTNFNNTIPADTSDAADAPICLLELHEMTYVAGGGAVVTLG